MLSLLLAALPVAGNNGFVAPGNGAAQLGLAGAGTALAEDAASTLRNPAAAVWIGSGGVADVGLALADGGYSASATDRRSQFGLVELEPGSNHSVSGLFPAPALAANWRLDDSTAIGWGATATGLQSYLGDRSATFARGIPTLQARCDGALGGGVPLTAESQLSGFCGNAQAGVAVKLVQLMLSAHQAWKPLPDLSIGLAEIVELQRLSAHGLAAAAPFSNAPDRVSDNGNDLAWGGGARFGVLWALSDGIGIGAAYQSRLYNTPFRRYAGAIPGGSVDFAPIIDVGLQIHVAPEQRLLFDVEQVRYGDLRLFRNRLDPQRLTDRCLIPRLLAVGRSSPPPIADCLGGSDGPGIGWHNITVYKFGYQGRRGRLTWRAGYSFGGNPVASDQVLLATLAPAVSDQHIAAGLSWISSPRVTIAAALVYAVKHKVTARNGFSNVRPTLFSNGVPLSIDVANDPLDQTITNHLGIWQLQLEIGWRQDR